MLSINDVLLPMPNKTTIIPGTNRYLGKDENDMAYLIRLDGKHMKAPFKVNYDFLLGSIKFGDLFIATNPAWDLKLPISENRLNPKELESFKKNCEIMEPLLVEDTLVDNERRAEAFEQRAKKYGVSVRTIQRLYYRYLGSGGNILALAPRFNNCGGPGGKQKKGARRGPKSETCIVPLQDVRKDLEKGANEFFLSGKFKLTTAYIKTLKKYFNNGVKFEADNGKPLPLEEILIQSPFLPTERTFEYICVRAGQENGKRKKSPMSARPVVPKKEHYGSVRDNVRGPGHRYEIDATKMQVQMVSIFGRQILIGTATLYHVIDVWSGAIVGYVLSLEFEGWSLAAQALRSCFMDKGLVFERLGLPYTSEDWPCNHLPARLSADRGAFKGEKPEVFVEESGITIEIGPPMQPERRPLVESSFRNIKYGDYYEIAGKYPKFPRRREPDGKNTAALTMDELELVVVEKILDLNNESAPIHAIPADMLKEDDPDISHIGLWRWGLKNRSGYTRTLSEQDFFHMLLTRDNASVTAKGLSFEKQTFTSPRLSALGYLAKAANDGQFQVEIRYDEHHADTIWFYDKELKEWTPAVNTNDDIRRLKVSFLEVAKHMNYLKGLRTKNKYENIHKMDEKSKWLKKMTKNAEKEAKEAKRGMSKSQTKGRMKENATTERMTRRFMSDLDSETAASYLSALESSRNESPNKPGSKDGYDEILDKINNKSVSSITKKLWGDT